MYGTVHRSDWDVYRLLATSTDPWSIGDIGILDNNQLANGPGISETSIEAKPWCTGKQLLSGFNLTGHFRMILKILLKKKGTSGKLQAMLDNGSGI